MSALILLNEHTGDFRYWDGAIQSAKFLAKAWDPGCMAMPFECEPEVQKYSYFFDTGIIVRGLLAAWRKSGHAALLSVATLCGECIAYDFFDDRNFHPILTLPDKKPLPHEESRWSRSPGCYQLKAALALRELSEVIHEDRFSELYHRLLQWSLASHRSFLPGATSPLAVMDRLHAYSYFLEGLLPMVNEAECLVAMRSGIETLSHYATEIAPQFLRSDVIAQLLRVRIFADCAGVVPLNPSVARREAALLLEFQSEAPDPRLAGGFWFGRKEKMLPFMNPVSTAFCYQALAMWDLYQKGERRFDWRNLI